MHTEVHNAVTAADQGTQYDESAKRLLGQKSILAQILVRTVDEFKGMNPRYVETLIEGEPYISRIPLELLWADESRSDEGEIRSANHGIKYRESGTCRGVGAV